MAMMTSAESTTHPSSPAPAVGREHAIDALRGFALLGILMVNAGSFASTYFGVGVSDPAFSRPVDHAVRWLVSFFFETKFYLLFSMLFGYSFALQMDAARRTGSAFVPRFLRRLLGLLLLGLVHAWLLFAGDILVTYALLGVLLLVWRGLKPMAATVLAGTSNHSLCILCSARLSVRTGWKVPAPTCSVTSAVRMPRSCRAASTASSKCKAAVGAATAPGALARRTRAPALALCPWMTSNGPRRAIRRFSGTSVPSEARPLCAVLGQTGSPGLLL